MLPLLCSTSYNALVYQQQTLQTVLQPLFATSPNVHYLDLDSFGLRTLLHPPQNRDPRSCKCMGGGGGILEAYHGCRRNLNVCGLDAHDLRTAKPDGSPWNVDLAADREEARMLIQLTQPTLLIGNPPCTSCCRLNEHWHYPRMCPESVAELKEQGRRHVRVMISLYRMQLKAGRHILHEHPFSEPAWDCS